MAKKPKASKVRRQKRTVSTTTFRQMVERDLNGSLLDTFENATEQEKTNIEKDTLELIKDTTDFKTYANTPRGLRVSLLQKSIGFQLFGV